MNLNSRTLFEKALASPTQEVTVTAQALVYLLPAIEAEAVVAEHARIKAAISAIRDDPALDGVMGLGWDAIEQIVDPTP